MNHSSRQPVALLIGSENTTPLSTVVSIELTYLTEGAANIVYVVTISKPQTHSIAESYILRLRKDLPFLVSSQQTVEQFQTRIVPLFDPKLLLDHHLFPLPPQAISELDDQLKLKEAEPSGSRWKRLSKRVGVYLPSHEEEPFGILMNDMSVDENKGHRLIEFKPKWLIQSSSAPNGATRCRNCALREMRNAENITQGRGDSGFCPLDLLSADSTILAGALAHIWPFESGLDEFVAAFPVSVQPALRDLQRLQDQYNCVGLADFLNPNFDDLPVAMALRDCSAFMQVSQMPGKTAVDGFKFADLDLKSVSGGKLEKWRDTERRLVDDRWYVGRAEPVKDLSQPQCAFGRG